MPLYAVEPHRYPGSVFPPDYPWVVTDGRGSVVEDCRAADTDTGYVVRLATNVFGEWVPDPNEPGRLLEFRESRPLPLTVARVPAFVGWGDDADEPHVIEGGE